MKNEKSGIEKTSTGGYLIFLDNMEINEYTAKRFEQIQTERGTLGAICWLLHYMLLNN